MKTHRRSHPSHSPSRVRVLAKAENRPEFTLRPLALALAAALMVLLAVLLGGCGSGESSPQEAAPETTSMADAPEGTTTQTYEVRGRVRQLPRADQPGTEFLVQHEEIPNFIGVDGETTIMGSMTMPFPADPALLADLKQGDPIRLTLVVDWEGSNPLVITAIEKLPPDTQLAFD